MRRIRIVGLCLVAMFAVSAVVAGAASAALPEYLSLNKKTKKFETNTAKITLTGTGTGSKLEGGVVIECTSDTTKGAIEGAKHSSKTKVTYSGCTAPSISSSCQKSPAKPGVIVTESLHGDLAYASETPGGPLSVVNHLTPEKAGKPFAKWTCGPKKELTVTVTGDILGEASPVNAGPSKTGKTINKEKAKEEGFNCSKQQFLFLNGAGSCLHLTTAAGTAWNIANETLTYKSEVELKG